MNSLDRFLQDRKDRSPPPFQIVLGPRAAALVGAYLPEGAAVLRFEGDRPPAVSGPAILVVRPEDLIGPHRKALLEIARAAQPGRPVLCGGSRDRAVLLEAINVWRVFRVVPDGAGKAVVTDAVTKAYQAACLETGIEAAADDLRQDTSRLEQALESLKSAQKQLRHAERLATLGRITRSLIPSLATHLDALEDLSASLGSAPTDPELEELLACGFSGVRSLHAMLEQVRAYADNRDEEYRMEVEDLDRLVGFAVSFSRFDPLAAPFELRSELGAQARVRVDGQRLQQVMVNLLRNAFQAAPARGTILVRTASEDGAVVIDVENTGPAIPPEIQARLFEPFVSTKGENGLGLGLSMCKATVEQHGGTITHERTGDRTRFRIRLPRME